MCLKLLTDYVVLSSWRKHDVKNTVQIPVITLLEIVRWVFCVRQRQLLWNRGFSSGGKSNNGGREISHIWFLLLEIDWNLAGFVREPYCGRKCKWMECAKLDVKRHFKIFKNFKGKYQNKLYLHWAPTKLN